MTCSTEYSRPNTSCSYKCKSEDFYFTGERTRTCQEDGRWSGSPAEFSCQPREREESLLVVGGLYPPLWPEFVSEVEEFTGSLTSNTSVPSLPSGRAYLTAAGLGDLVSACFGARDCSSDCSQPQVECLLWQEGSDWFNPREDGDYRPPAVLYRENADSVLVDNTVWIIGGRHSNQSLISSSTVEIFRPSCLVDPGPCSYWTTGPDLPYTVYDSCSVEITGSVFVSGGHGPGYPGQYGYDKLIRYELRGDTPSWETLRPLSVDRYGHGCAELGGEMYVSGGYSWTQDRLDRVEVYSPHTDTWRQVGSLAVPRNNHRMVLLNNILTVVGGYGAPASEYWAPEDLDSIEEYHEDIDRWVVRETRLSLPRRSFGAAVITRNRRSLTKL